MCPPDLYSRPASRGRLTADVLCPQCCNLLLVETLKDPLCFKVSDQTIPKQQHVVQVSPGGSLPKIWPPIHRGLHMTGVLQMFLQVDLHRSVMLLPTTRLQKVAQTDVI